MKKLYNEFLVYDEKCKLSILYITILAKINFLHKDFFRTITSLTSEELQYINIDKARKYTVICNPNSKKVYYGFNSFLKILNRNYPFIAYLFKIPILNYFVRKFFKLLYYNKNVIFLNADIQENKNNNSFNYKYRSLFIVINILLAPIILENYACYIYKDIEFKYFRSLMLAIGQQVILSILILNYNFEKKLDYIGQNTAISIGGLGASSIFLIVNYFIKVPEIVLITFIGLTIGVTFQEHLKRIEILKLPFYLSIGWMLYTIFVLAVITLDLF